MEHFFSFPHGSATTALSRSSTRVCCVNYRQQSVLQVLGTGSGTRQYFTMEWNTLFIFFRLGLAFCEGSTPLPARRKRRRAPHLRTRVGSEVLGLVSGEHSAGAQRTRRRLPHLRTRVHSEVLGLVTVPPITCADGEVLAVVFRQHSEYG